MEEEKAPLISMLIQIGAKRCNLIRDLSFQAMQALYSPSGSLKVRLFGASQKHIELWKVSGANCAAGWRSQGAQMKPRISSVPRAALGALHSRMKTPQVSSHPAPSLHIRSAVQVILSLGSLRRTQVSGHIWVFLSAAVTPPVQVAEQLWQDHLQNFMWKIMAVSYPPVLKPCLRWLGLRHFAEHLWLQHAIFKYDQSSKAQMKTRKLIFLMFSVGGGSERQEKFREPTDFSAPSSHLFTIHCNLPNN